jgi:hypothetical protein
MKTQTAALFFGICACLTTHAQPVPVVIATPSIGTGMEISSDQPATVDAYFNVGLLPSVAGTIRFLQKDIGDTFTAGETLVEIEPLGTPDTRTPLVAPFDGVVASRSADPGLFVASAAVVPEVKSLLELQRMDIVTVVAQVPESFAVYLDDTTRCELRIDALPGLVFECKPTRYAPNFADNDRTRQVQVDLFNGTAAQFDDFIQKIASSPQNSLKGGKQPQRPGGIQPGESPNLMPGMFGSLRLVATRFKNSPLVPSSAILRQGGVPYLMQVENGVARKRRITIEVDNGTMARVRWADGPQATELSPEDQFLAANPSAFEDGTAVAPAQATP